MNGPRYVMDQQLVTLPAPGLSWLSQSGLILVGVACVSLIVHLAISRVRARFRQSPNLWDDAALEAAEVPAQTLVWILGLELFASVLRLETGIGWLAHAHRVREFLLIVIVSWFFFRLLGKFEQNARGMGEGEGGFDATDAAVLSRVLRIVVASITFLVLLGKLGYSPTALLAFGGVGGIIFGFAAKDLLANVFGGLLVFLDRPFEINHKIRSPDRSIEGEVRHIGWRLTRIETVDKRELYVPNSVFASIAVENRTRMTHRLINTELEVSIREPADAARIAGSLRDMFRCEPKVDCSIPFTVAIDRIGGDRATLLVHVYVTEIDRVPYYDLKERLLLRAARIIHAEGLALTEQRNGVAGTGRPGTTRERGDGEDDGDLACQGDSSESAVPPAGPAVTGSLHDSPSERP